jgi:hypothetical protein
MRSLFLIFSLFLVSCRNYKNGVIVCEMVVPTNPTLHIDSDKDGVNDNFDRCPKTPSGVAVTTKGCPKDTDGDGVADFKDKELNAPITCQPTDSNGVGDCKRKWE